MNDYKKMLELIEGMTLEEFCNHNIKELFNKDDWNFLHERIISDEKALHEYFDYMLIHSPSSKMKIIKVMIEDFLQEKVNIQSIKS